MSYSIPTDTQWADLASRVKSANSGKVYYGTCSTGASTAAKVVSCTGFALTTGAYISVKFTNGNSYNGTATMNVNSTGAVDIARVGDTKTTRYYWTAGEVVDFIYDGTNYVMVNKGTATTTYYGQTKLSSSTSSTSEALAATPKAVKAAYDLANGKQSPATTLAGYGITDAYTKTQVSGMIQHTSWGAYHNV